MSEYVNSGEGSHSERGRLLGGALLYTGMWRASCPQPYVKALLFYAPKVLKQCVQDLSASSISSSLKFNSLMMKIFLKLSSWETELMGLTRQPSHPYFGFTINIFKEVFFFGYLEFNNNKDN